MWELVLLFGYAGKWQRSENDYTLITKEKYNFFCVSVNWIKTLDTDMINIVMLCSI